MNQVRYRPIKGVFLSLVAAVLIGFGAMNMPEQPPVGASGPPSGSWKASRFA